MSISSLKPIWTPEDSAALAADAAAFPSEVGQSIVLDIIVDCEHLR